MHKGARVDEHAHALVLHQLVKAAALVCRRVRSAAAVEGTAQLLLRVTFTGIVEGVGQAVAAAALHAQLEVLLRAQA